MYMPSIFHFSKLFNPHKWFIISHFIMSLWIVIWIVIVSLCHYGLSLWIVIMLPQMNSFQLYTHPFDYLKWNSFICLQSFIFLNYLTLTNGLSFHHPPNECFDSVCHIIISSPNFNPFLFFSIHFISTLHLFNTNKWKEMTPILLISQL